MAMMSCPECKSEVSSGADVCPKCGFGVRAYCEEYWRAHGGAPKEATATSRGASSARRHGAGWLGVLLVAAIAAIFIPIVLYDDPDRAPLSAKIIFGVGATIAAPMLYFLPWIVAAQSRHPSRAGIAAVNFFLGWTLIGWVVALAWAGSGSGDARGR